MSKREFEELDAWRPPFDQSLLGKSDTAQLELRVEHTEASAGEVVEKPVEVVGCDDDRPITPDIHESDSDDDVDDDDDESGSDSGDESGQSCKSDSSSDDSDGDEPPTVAPPLEQVCTSQTVSSTSGPLDIDQQLHSTNNDEQGLTQF